MYYVLYYNIFLLYNINIKIEFIRFTCLWTRTCFYMLYSTIRIFLWESIFSDYEITCEDANKQQRDAL